MKGIVINYHITEKCNYSCNYCFAKYGLEEKFKQELHHDLISVNLMLKAIYEHFSSEIDQNEIRLNFAGGEPLLLRKFPEIINSASKIGYKLSLITNGSSLTKKFIEDNVLKFSMLGISIDSFEVSTNHKIGRVTQANKIIEIENIVNLIILAKKINPKIVIKINTVVNEHNYNESMIDCINKISPDKWKIFKVLHHGNFDTNLTKEQFNIFILKHQSEVQCPIFIENNEDMMDSYLMVDPMGCFYQNNEINGEYTFSDPIGKISVKDAYSQISFNKNKFKERYTPFIKKT